MLRIGVLGLGYWGPKLAKNFVSVKGVCVSAVCDQRSELLQAVRQILPDAFATTDYAEMLSGDRVDAVAVVTAPQQHFDPVKRALESGKHVFVEKPLAVSYAEAVALKDLAAAARLVLMTDHTFCYDLAFARIRDALIQGELGAVRFARMEWLAAREKAAGPDVLWDSGPHAVAALQYFFGLDRGEVSFNEVGRLPGGVLAAAQGSLRSAAVAAELEIAWAGQCLRSKPVAKAARVTLFGDRATLVYEGSFGSRKAQVIPCALPHDWRWGMDTPKPAAPMAGLSYDDQPLVNACSAFAAAVAGQAPCITDGSFATGVVAVLEAAQRSLQSGGLPTAFQTR